MKRSRMIAGAATVAALAGGAAGAIAASGNGKATEDAVLADAAKRLGVTPQKLRDALGAAEDAQLDAAVKAGRLTQQQADALKQRREADGSVLRLGPPRGGDHDGPGFDHGPGGGPLDDLARALGITERQLFAQLQAGRSPAAIAKAHGKTLEEVKAAVKASVTKRLDAGVQAGRITKAQRDEILSHVADDLAHLGERPFGHRDHDGPFPGRPPGPPAPPSPATPSAP